MNADPEAAKPTVLVVEDELLLRMRAVDMVEDAGFNPLEAVNADDALALLESRSDIELLFTDIQMPGRMNGLKLAHAVHERWPSIKIILVSGQLTPGEEDRPANSRFFGKPLEVPEMIAELQDMIGQGALQIVPSATNAMSRDSAASQQSLTAENGSLRLLLEQAGIDAKVLLAQAGIDAKEREAADKLQKRSSKNYTIGSKTPWRPCAPLRPRACERRQASSTATRRLTIALRRLAMRTIC